MCGIAGIRRFGAEPIKEEQIKLLLCALEHRGNHATGIAIQEPTGKVWVEKDDVPAFNFVSSRRFAGFIEEHLTDETPTVLLHTRSATKGSPRKSANNHPLFIGKTAVVHNGCLTNDDELFKRHRLERSGEVDSDILRAILDEWGITKEGIEKLSQVRGSAALAAISEDAPGKLLLARAGSPLVLASTRDQLCFASEKAAIHQAMRPFVKRFGVWMQPQRAELALITMNTDSAWILGELKEVVGDDPTALEWHGEFKPCTYYTPPNYSVHSNYRDKLKRLTSGDAEGEMIRCPNKACGEMNALPDKFKGLPLKKLRCFKCGSKLGKKN